MKLQSNSGNAEMKNRSRDWLRQAENDILWAHDSKTAGRYSQTCFIAQQVGEKALKALALHRGWDEVRSHSILEISQALAIDGEIEKMAKRLDLYYISARYPDAFSSGAAFEYFAEDQAVEAIAFAEKIVAFAAAEIENG